MAPPLVALAVSTSVLLCAAPAAGHVPGLEPRAEDDPVTVGGPEASRAVYGYLAPGEDHDEYEFVSRSEVTRTVGIIVPAYPEHDGFRPTLVVAPQGGDAVELPDPGDDPRIREFEPFSLAHFWIGGEREVGFEADRRYRLRVEPGGGESSGRYVIVFGGPEQFEAGDVADTLRGLPAIWFGTYGGAPLRWNPLALIPIGIAAAILAAAALGLRRLVLRFRRR